jgi:hypothetical protein
VEELYNSDELRALHLTPPPNQRLDRTGRWSPLCCATRLEPLTDGAETSTTAARTSLYSCFHHFLSPVSRFSLLSSRATAAFNLACSTRHPPRAFPNQTTPHPDVIPIANTTTTTTTTTTTIMVQLGVESSRRRLLRALNSRYIYGKVVRLPTRSACGLNGSSSRLALPALPC